MGDSKKMEIAIIGAGLLFPAKIESLSDLWDFMMQRKNAAVDIPQDRWSKKRYYSPVPQAAGKTTMAQGNFILHNAKAFDCAIFGLSPREASLLDPLQRNILFAAWRAIEDAKLPPSRLKGTKTGVYIGAFLDDFLVYAGRSEMRAQIQDHYSAVSSTAGMVSARLGYVFNLLGPAMSIDTACSSSMTAIVRACEDLRQGNCDMAFAGGSSYMMIPEPSITMSKAGFLAKDGRSKSFSSQADGYGRGEGAGILLLKPLDKALADNDPIRAVITEGALNQDGRTSAVPVPSRKAQSLLMKSLLDRAEIHADDISAVEAHGAGTPVGDPIEASAISGAIAENRSEDRKLLPISSIKANIGHLEASAGVAGAIRAMLCLENKMLPPWPCEGKPADFLSDHHLHLPVKGMKLPAVKKGKSHYILANSFGYGGANAAILMRSLRKTENVKARRKSNKDKVPEPFFVLSAASSLALKYLAKEYAVLLENFLSAQDVSDQAERDFWQELCENLLTQKDLLTHRLVLRKEDKPLSEMVKILSDFAQAEVAPQSEYGLYPGEISDSVPLKNIFLIFADAPAISLREGAVFLLDLPTKIAPKFERLLKARQKQLPQTDLKADIFETLREAGKFQALPPFIGALLQIAAGEYLQSFGLQVSAALLEDQKNPEISAAIALYFNGKITVKTALACLCGGKSLKESFPIAPSSIFLGLRLGNIHGQHDSVALKRRLSLEQALKDAAGALLAKGGWIEPFLTGGRSLLLPSYPMRLEMLAGPERLMAQKDRVDLTVHPLLGTVQEGAEKSWKADLTTGFLPWLPDHAMRRDNAQASDWLLPFAAFVEAGLAAHKNMTGNAGCVLENMQLKTPLFPARDLTSLAFWSFDQKSGRFKLASWTPASIGGENPFTSHGSVVISKSAPWGSAPLASEIDSLNMEMVDISDFYQNLRRFGIYYGPTFRAVKNLKISGRKAGDIALSEIALPKILREQEAENQYLLHPVLLDGAFQTIAALMPETSETAYAPFSMACFIWHGRKTEAPLTEISARMILKSFSENALVVDGYLYDSQGQMLAEIRELECIALAKKKHCSLLEAKWESLPALSLLAERQTLFTFGAPDEMSQKALSLLESNGRLIEHFTSLSDFQKALKGNNSIERLIYFPDPKQSDNPMIAMSALFQEMRSLFVSLPLEKKFSFYIVGEGAFAGLENLSFEARALLLSPLVGVIRAARVEYPWLSFKIIFFQGKEIELEKALAAELVSENIAETEIFLDAGRRLGLQAHLLKPLSLSQEKTENLLEAQGGSEYALTLVRDYRGHKFTQGLGWERQILPPLSQGLAKVRTIAVGLNFKDFLNVMGFVPDFVFKNTHTAGILGLEALVEIEESSPGEHGLEKGDLCLSFVSGAFASHRLLTTDPTFLFPIPRGIRKIFSLSMIKALAGFSVAAATVWACLVRLANLEAGETILIHSAAGGVGQMALQIAQLKGARIFATAGSEERRLWLKAQKNVEGVFDSRTLAFYDGVKAATKGHGVDVALNVLSGEALQATLKLMAPFGRFIEIGKRDIIEGNSLNLTPFNENLVFFSYDLDKMLNARPELFRKDCEKIYSLIMAQKIMPPQSTFFSVDKVQEAFRHFASSGHSGRIIVDFSPEATEKKDQKLSFRESPKNIFFEDKEAVHLITGGTGGFGIETLRWLLKNGARHLCVFARKEPSENSEWQKLLEQAEEVEAEIQFYAVDFSNEKALEKTFLRITAKRKIGTIFHAAGSLKDTPLASLSAEDIAEVFVPKVGGALAIWRICERNNLKPDNFVLYSSLAGFTGNFGQSAYSAANVFLDVFAGYLRKQGVNAFSIAWGAIAQGGMVKQSNSSVIFRQSGIGQMKAEEALEAMAVFMQAKKSWGAVAAVDWPLFFKMLPELGKEARFSLLNEREPAEGNKALLSLPSSERRAFALKVILEEISAILQCGIGGVTARTPLESLGLDSLAGMELQMAVQKRLGIELPVSILATARTPDALAGKIAGLTLEAV